MRSLYLVTYVVSANRKVFEPVAPKKLKEILEEKQENLKKILPELESKIGKESSFNKLKITKKGLNLLKNYPNLQEFKSLIL